MKSTKKAKPHRLKTSLQASTNPATKHAKETPAKIKRGFKRPRPELEEIIRTVNMLPADPPALPLTIEAANSLPSQLSAYLNQDYDDAFEYSESTTHAWDVMEWRLKETIEAREALRQLMDEATQTTDEETICFFGSIDARAYLLISKDRRVTVAMSSFARAVEGIEIDYLRECQTCGNIFYAGRKNQPCCTVKCAKAQRQKRWRKRFKEGEPAYHK